MGQIQRREVCQLMVNGPGAPLPQGISHMLLAGDLSRGILIFHASCVCFSFFWQLMQAADSRGPLG